MKQEEQGQSVGQGIFAKSGAWHFGGDVPVNFDEHVARSVPYYKDGHDLVLKLAPFFVSDHSICYELGVSTGALIKKLIDKVDKSATWVGIDVVPEMIEKAKETLGDHPNLKLYQGDLITFPYAPTDFVVSYYTIQFVPPRQRQEAINKIYEALNWGGAFVLFEKVRGPDARFQDIFTSLYTDFKLEQGHTPAQIVAKSKSLRGVLEPFSSSGNYDLLKRAGFKDIATVFKYHCFEGILAIK